MNRFVLSTEDVFEKSGSKMRVVTSGINLSERFEDNPVMLFEHDTSKVLGVWDSVEKSDNLTAIPIFDDDEDSAKIANKVKRKTLKSASIGIEVKDAYMDGDVLVISESVLLEASIVSIPANKKAKTVDFKLKNPTLKLSNGEDFDIEKFKNNNMDIKNIDEVIEPNKVEEVKEDVIEASADTPEVVEEVEETKVELSKEAELELKLEDITSEKIQLGLKLKELETKVTELVSNKEELTLSIKEKDNKISELELSVTNLMDEKMEMLLSSAVAEGKISNEAKDDFKELSYVKAQSILSKIIPSEVSLSKVITENREEGKDYNWYLKNDPNYLKDLSKNNPEALRQLQNKLIKK